MTPERAILIVEDEPALADLLRLHLGDLGYEVEVARDGQRGLERALQRPFALVLLDLMLPGLDGLEVCRRLRQAQRPVPVLMLTARSDEGDKVIGLDVGADDYVTKPFSVRELMARVRALLRRVEMDAAQPSGQEEALRFGDLVIHPQKRKVTLGGAAVELTAKEFDLLTLFAREPGRVFSREELLDLVWGYQYAGYSHTVNSHINRLRGKIERDPSAPRFIRTVWGVGYRFAEAEELITDQGR
ncbi:MAG TPA: response regulator transcription factor [Rubricoccaceae bacterium]|nr:response regulator transcription factor [Rubricoccaceae bacterium]